jgi:hypothetical protein
VIPDLAAEEGSQSFFLCSENSAQLPESVRADAPLRYLPSKSHPQTQTHSMLSYYFFSSLPLLEKIYY